VPDTYAGVDDLVRDFDYRPSTTVERGVQRFDDWYLDFYGTDAPQGSPAAGSKGRARARVRGSAQRV